MGTDTQWRCQSSESGAALMPHDRAANGRRLLLSLVTVLFVMGSLSCGDPAETEGLQIEVWGRFFHVIFGCAILDILDDGTILIL